MVPLYYQPALGHPLPKLCFNFGAEVGEQNRFPARPVNLHDASAAVPGDHVLVEESLPVYARPGDT